MQKNRHKSKKVMIATGGTGGHIFPAQILAEQLLEHEVSVIFLGSGLEKNRYFKKERFLFKQVSSSTPFKRNLLFSCFKILKGTVQSLKQIFFINPILLLDLEVFMHFQFFLQQK